MTAAAVAPRALGASQRSRRAELTQGSVINRVIRLSGHIGVHIISEAAPEEPVEPTSRAPVAV